MEQSKPITDFEKVYSREDVMNMLNIDYFILRQILANYIINATTEEEKVLIAVEREISILPYHYASNPDAYIMGNEIKALETDIRNKKIHSDVKLIQKRVFDEMPTNMKASYRAIMSIHEYNLKT
jgi:hypothetical protein